MQFEWDPDKNRANLLKHGIDFELSALVFDETGERRWHALGLAAGLKPVLLVVHVYGEAINGEEIARIIPARKARKSEHRAYLQ